MKGGIKAASNLIVVFYFNRQDSQKIGTSTKQKVLKSGRPKFECLKYLNVPFKWQMGTVCMAMFF
jgi:hypothetical protein